MARLIALLVAAILISWTPLVFAGHGGGELLRMPAGSGRTR